MENSRKVADQLVDMLADAGVNHVYGITGDSLNEITAAICNDGRVKFVHMRHEESGAFAASAEAQLTGHLACCAGSSGPGHVHLINGLYDAMRSNAPVLAIASTCSSAVAGLDYFQATDPTLLFSNCSVYNQTATTPAQFQGMMQAAMQTAISRGGVGVIAIPQDLNGQAAVDSPSAPVALPTSDTPVPDAESIKKAVDLLNGASKVAIYAGCGTKNALPQLLKLASLLKAPVATTFKSTMYLTNDNPYYVGHIGYLGMWSAQEAIDQADLILLIGENFPYVGEFPTDRKIIQIDIRAERLGRRVKTDLGIRADAAMALDAIIPGITQKDDDSFLKGALANFTSIKEKMQEPVKNPGKTGCIRPEFVFDTLNRLAADDCIFTVDTGMSCVWASHYLTPAKGRQMVGSFTHGSMANALPMAIGATMALPGRQVISLSGDGGLAMLMGELLTVIQYQLPVKILVADNRSLAYVKWEMQLAGFKPWETELTNPDFGEMARSMGFKAWTVKDPAVLEATMAQWLAADGPALLSVTTDTDAASFTFSRKGMENANPGDPVWNFRLPGA